MEETDAGAVDAWRGIELSSNGLWSGNFFEPCSSNLDVELFSGGDIGVDNDDATELEVSELGFDEEAEKTGHEIGEEDGAGFGGVRIAGSIAERRAAKFGFSAPNINTHLVRPCSSLGSPRLLRSPYLTIPPGINPDALLDSPIMLMLPYSQPSPTTGTFSVPVADIDSAYVDSAFQSTYGDEGCDGGSSLKSHRASSVSLASVPGLTSRISRANDMIQAKGIEHGGSTMVSLQSQVKIEFSAQCPGKESPKEFDNRSLADIKASDCVAVNINSDLPICDPDIVSGCDMSPDNEPFQEEEATECDYVDPERKGKCPTVESFKASDDGYNWRKYGQKQVKGSEYPRSYYKCTHPNCPVKKKIERSNDGQITEIIYKGAHCHPKPQFNHRSTFSSLFFFTELSEASEGSGFCLETDDGPVGRTTHHHSRDVKVGTDWRVGGLERTSSISGVTEVSDPLSISQGNLVGVLESTGNPELSSIAVNQEVKEEDAAALSQGSMLLGDDEDKESDTKRRRTEGSFVESTLSYRGVREPRVVVQIESDIDILDDGYRWRKYGQKVVKGNPNPRSYYKCTSAGCTVRKHLERASHDLKYVITTYEGKHNHEPPAARNSSQTSASGGNWPPTAPNTTGGLALSCGSHLPKPEPPDLVPQLDGKVEHLSDFFRPDHVGSYGTGTSSFYPMKIPTLPGPPPYIPYGMNLGDTHPYPPIVPPVPDLSIPSTFGLPGPSTLATIDFIGRNRTFVRTFLARGGESDMEFLRPKQERRDDSS